MLLAHVILKAHLHPEDILGIGIVACIGFALVKLSNWLKRKGVQ